MAKKIQNKAKGKAWDMFSRFIRTRDCLKTTGLSFVGICITCDRKFHIRYLQAGHCIPGRSNAKLFNEELVNAQCKYCNEVKHGEKKKYEAVIIKIHGAEWFEQAKIQAKKVIHDSDIDFERKAEEYKNKYEELLRGYGFKTWLELLQANQN